MENEKELIDYLHDQLEKLNEKNYFFKMKDGQCGVYTMDNINNEALSMSYKYFNIDKEPFYTEDQIKLKRIYIKNEAALNTVVWYLKEGMLEHFWDTVLMIEEAFSKNLTDVKKFRGDLGEAIFCYVKGAEKNLDDMDSTDVRLNGETVEIKSCSEGIKKITISKQQSENDVETYMVSLIHGTTENGAMSIVDIATKFGPENAKFKKELLDKYSNQQIGTLFKFKVDEEVIENITSIVHKSINSKGMIEATFLVPDEI